MLLRTLFVTIGNRYKRRSHRTTVKVIAESSVRYTEKASGVVSALTCGYLHFIHDWRQVPLSPGADSCSRR